jgi:hypothetical protein
MDEVSLALRPNPMRYVALQHPALRCDTLQCHDHSPFTERAEVSIALHRTTLPSFALRCCTMLRYAVRPIAFRCAAVRCLALLTHVHLFTTDGRSQRCSVILRCTAPCAVLRHTALTTAFSNEKAEVSAAIRCCAVQRHALLRCIALLCYDHSPLFGDVCFQR